MRVRPQDVKDCAHWAQQVHDLNRELKVQRYSWEQVHTKYMEAESMLQVRSAHAYAGGGR